jgi:hypothetical protein
MTAVARNTEEEQRRAWRDYAERLRGLEGAEYDRAEPAAWDALQEALHELGVEPTTADHRSV